MSAVGIAQCAKGKLRSSMTPFLIMLKQQEEVRETPF